MKIVLSRIAVLAMMLFVAGQIPAGAEPASAPAALTLPVTGTFAQGGDFTGTISINRFEQRDNHIVAIGFVSGVLSKGGRTLGTVVVGERAWPVALKWGGDRIANGRLLETARAMPIAWSPGARPSLRVLPVQAGSCQVLDVALGPMTVDVLGFQVALSAVTLNVSGATGTPLGDLVCSVSSVLDTVAGLVNLLNGVLGLLTGLLGGLTGGLGGV